MEWPAQSPNLFIAIKAHAYCADWIAISVVSTIPVNTMEVEDKADVSPKKFLQKFCGRYRLVLICQNFNKTLPKCLLRASFNSPLNM